MVGSTLSHYRILRKIGAGGMGEVYCAHDEQLDRDVALKVLPPGSFTDENARARLLREARAAAGLNHPNICTVYEVGEAGGQAHIAMELIEGPCLSDRLQQEGLPAAVLRYGMQIADALAHAHERRVIHRDLKTANVVITQDDRVKVLDFGLAKRLPGEELSEATTQSHAPLTQAGAMVGTLAYMAPEQLRGQPADARTDIWSLGVVLHEMAAGVRPFQGRTGFELCSAILNQAPARLPAKTPLELRAVIERCLAKEPSQRYQRAGEVRAALETIHSGAAIPWRGLRYALGRRPWLAVAALAVVLVVAVLALDLGGLRSRLLGRDATAMPIRSLAVLPLINLSGDTSQEYFADGMTDALITDLSRLAGLNRVIARGSVMRFKDTDKSLAEIAGELGVERLITGAVQRSGERVSITAQLIDPASGRQLWAERYERELRDVLSLQNEIVAAIVSQMQVELTPQERTHLAAARVVNPQAYEAVLKGRFHIQKLTPADFALGLQYCHQALKIDPNYALGYVCLTSALGAPAHMGLASPLTVADEAMAAAWRAVELDPTLAEAYARVGSWSFLFKWDWQATESAFQKAGDADWTRIVYADFLMLMGRNEEALAMMQRAMESDPLNTWVQVAVGGRMLRLRRDDEGIALLQKVLISEPNMGLAHRYLWTAFHNQGKYEQALEEAKTFLNLLGHPGAAQALQRGHAESGYTGVMRLAADLLAKRSEAAYVQPTEIARLYAYAGDKDRAFGWLDKAYETRDTWMAFINSDPRFNSLHSDPRFTELLRRMKVPH